MLFNDAWSQLGHAVSNTNIVLSTYIKRENKDKKEQKMCSYNLCNTADKKIMGSLDLCNEMSIHTG